MAIMLRKCSTRFTILVFCALVVPCSAAVSDTTCNPADNDGATGESATCKAVDENAVCPVDTTNCACKDEYKEDNPDSNTCVLKAVSEIDCDPGETDATTGGAAVCKAVDENAECPVDTSNCACKDGYKEGSPDSHTCVLKEISDYTCNSNDNDPTTGESAACKAVDENAECPDGDTSCKCKSGYKQHDTIVNTCEKAAVSEITCDEGDKDCIVDQSECDAQNTPMCKCSNGYKEDSNDGSTCVKIPDVSAIDCNPTNTDETTGGAAVCKAVDVNAECPAGKTKCACKNGYKEGNPDSHTCVLKEISDYTCDSKDNDPTTGESAACKAVDDNAECPDGETSCKCKSGYKQHATIVNTCEKAAESSATSVWMTPSLLVTSMLLYLTRFILW